MEIESEQIKKDIVDQLYWDTSVDASDVIVEVRNGNVKLTGTVPSFAARRAAYTDATMIPGMNSVDNQLEVRHPKELPAITDEELKARAEQMLQWSAELDATDIHINVVNGMVTLEGSVDAYWKKTRTEDLLSMVAGIRDIANMLAVVPSHSPEDRLIAEDIISSLKRNVNINVSRISVEVNDGMVNLTDQVPNLVAYLSASDVAEYTAGVRDVINNLTID
jgi:osmotically-inducible protein OsmY